jgi:predicted transglutaminase-like cysteine proteinase
MVMNFVDRSLIDDINYRVNKLIAYKRDSVENWQRPEVTKRIGTGDCEDYAILKAKMLVEAGVDPSILKIGVVRTRKSQSLHAVLIVPSRYRKGFFRRKWVDCQYVMDNMSDNLFRWEETGYVMTRLELVEKWI